MSNRIRAEIFDNEGPLATFGAKIKIGYAMGLYGPEIKADLDCIRRIRNYFAHTMRPLTFRDARIKKICGDWATGKNSKAPLRSREFLKKPSKGTSTNITRKTKAP